MVLDREGFFINYFERSGHHYFELEKKVSSWQVLTDVTYDTVNGILVLNGTVEQYSRLWYEALNEEQFKKYTEKYVIDHYYETSKWEKFFRKYYAIRGGWYKRRNDSEKIQLKTSLFTIKTCENF